MLPGSLDANARSFRVNRTFAFLDLCGFTDFVDAHGDDEAVDELRALRATVRDVAPLCGVRVDKWLGDGVMLVGVDVEPVVAAVVAICNQMTEVGELPMRAGIATGPVIILEGDDYVGKAVNTAARLCDRADAGTILASTDALVLPEWVEAESCQPLRVRGLADPVEIVSLSAADGAGPHAALLAPATAIMSVVDGLVRPLRALKRA